jgi:hypothetical protein
MALWRLRLADAVCEGSDVSKLFYQDYLRRGPPFIEVDGVWYLNVAFELPPEGRSAPSGTSRDPMALRRLTAKETALLLERRLDADLEVWAKITA